MNNKTDIKSIFDRIIVKYGADKYPNNNQAIFNAKTFKLAINEIQSEVEKSFENLRLGVNAMVANSIGMKVSSTKVLERIEDEKKRLGMKNGT